MMLKRLRLRSLFVVAAAICVMTLEATALPFIAYAALAGNIDDCQNGTTGVQPCNSTDPGDWSNGNLTASKARYFEGDSVPFRLEGTGLNTSLASHTMVFSWDTTKSGKHAFDYITTYTRTVTAADACAGQPFACGGATTFAIPPDPHVTAAGVTPVPGNLTMFNGTITSVSAYTLTGSYAADSTTQIAVNFTTSSSNVVLAWGEHVATRADWGLSGSASSISGSPYHVHLVSVDGGGGSQDHQMQSAVVVLPASLSIVKDAQPDSTQAFPFTTTGGLSPATFSLIDNGGNPGCGTDTNTQCYAKIADFTTTFAITENSTPGWSLSGITFAVTSPNGGTRTVSGSTATIKFGQGEYVTATFTNKVNAPSFSVTKTADAATSTPGGTVSYTIKVTNTGGPGVATVTDTYVPATVAVAPAGCTNNTATGTLVCTTPSIPTNGSVTFTYTATMPASFTTGAGTQGCAANQYPVVDIVVVTGGATAKATVCVSAAPQFVVSKVANTATSTPGGSVVYTVTVTNTGTAAGATTVTDTYAPATVATAPAGCTNNASTSVLTCPSGTLAPLGGHMSFSYSATMPASFTTGAGTQGCAPSQYPVVDTVTVNGGASAQATVCVTANPQFVVSKVANTATATPGGSVVYTVTVTNTGTAAGSTSVTDTYAPATLASFPANCTNNAATGVLTCPSGTLAPLGGHTSFSYTATMPASFATGAGSLGCGTNQYPVVDTVTVNGGASAMATVCVTANPQFVVSKVANTATATPGGSVVYTVTVTNTGTAAGATSVTDTYAPATLASFPANCTNNAATGVLTCPSGTLAPLGGHTSFSYTATMPASFSGPPNGDGCTGTNQYPVVDTVTVNGGASAQAVVCVPANPQFTVAKSANPTSTTPGATVTYTVTVSNVGAGPGSTTVTDTYAPATLLTFPSACQNNTPTAGVLTCTTGTLAARTGSQSFVYTAAMPNTFSGTPDGGGCTGTNQFAVIDTVTVNGGATATATECVTANPNLTLGKAAGKTSVTSGDLLTYTLTYANTGAGPASNAVITDPVPTGTVETSCSSGCTTPGGVATWSVGTVAAGGGGAVTMTVQVQPGVGCQIANLAAIASPDQNAGAPVSSNTVFVTGVPGPDPAGAHASGSAVAATATVALVGINAQFAPTATAVSGVGLQSNNAMVLSASVAALGVPVLSTDVLTTASTSQVTAAPAEAKDTTNAEVANVNVLNGVVTADTVRAVASTNANGGASSFSAAGSTIVNLKVLGVPTDVTPNLVIPLPALTFGSGSYVAIFGQGGSTSGPAAGQLSGGRYAADLSVDMIRVHVTNLALLGAVDVTVAHAQSHADFPQTTICSTGGPTQSVSGHAFVASEVTSPSLLPLLFGYSSIPAKGGHGHSDVASVSSGVLTTGVAASDALGSVSASSSNSTDTVTVANACVLLVSNGGCAISAGAVTSTSTTASNASGSTSSDAGTQFLNLNVLGIAVTGTVAPNTVITLPGIGFVILNEQVCDGGSAASHTCTGATASGLTVRGIHVVVNKLGSGGLLPIGADVIVAEAHSDGRYGG